MANGPAARHWSGPRAEHLLQKAEHLWDHGDKETDARRDRIRHLASGAAQKPAVAIMVSAGNGWLSFRLTFCFLFEGRVGGKAVWRKACRRWTVSSGLSPQTTRLFILGRAKTKCRTGLHARAAPIRLIQTNKISSDFLVRRVLDIKRSRVMGVGCISMQSVYVALAVVISPRFRGQIRRGGVMFVVLCLVLFSAHAAKGQGPEIVTAGVVNAASYAQPISPGSIVAIFGTNLAPKIETAPGTPLPTILAGTTVTVNGTKAPLFYVSPHQINLQAPSSLVSVLGDGSQYGSATFVVTTPSGSSAPVQATVYGDAAGIFSLDASGCGRAVAFNVGSNGDLSVNSPANSAAPGDSIKIYGTGFGLISNAPPDGTPASGPTFLELAPEVLLDGQVLPSTQYAGLAPGLVGVNEINFQIPAGTREGCAVPIVVSGHYVFSPMLSISIHPGRGQCTDPPIQSYGQVTLTKTLVSGTSNNGETDTLSASFPSAPGLKLPPAPTPNPDSFLANQSVPIGVSRSCPVTGYQNLSAGDIQVESIKSGTSVTSKPIPQTSGVMYQQTLPTGFIEPGAYTISGSGAPVTFQGQLNIPPPIEIQTALTPGTTISESKGITIQWTGGEPGMLVTTSLVAEFGILNLFDVGYVDAGSGSFTFAPSCSGSPAFCTLFLTPSNTAEIIVELSPGTPTFAQNQGVTEGIQLSWVYRYVFDGLVLEP